MNPELPTADEQRPTECPCCGITLTAHDFDLHGPCPELLQRMHCVNCGAYFCGADEQDLYAALRHATDERESMAAAREGTKGTQ
jgi:hypothetical protein